MGRPVTRLVGLREVPEDVRSLSTVSEPDYVDMYSLESASDATAQTWARAMYEESLGARGRLIFGQVLGLKLAPPKTLGTVAGWRVAEQGEGWIRMEAEGKRVVGQIIVRTANGVLSVTTFIQYVSRLGSTTWTVWSILHRRAMPKLLRDAADRLEG